MFFFFFCVEFMTTRHGHTRIWTYLGISICQSTVHAGGKHTAFAICHFGCCAGLWRSISGLAGQWTMLAPQREYEASPVMSAICHGSYRCSPTGGFCGNPFIPGATSHVINVWTENRTQAKRMAHVEHHASQTHQRKCKTYTTGNFPTNLNRP